MLHLARFRKTVVEHLVQPAMALNSPSSVSLEAASFVVCISSAQLGRSSIPTYRLRLPAAVPAAVAEAAEQRCQLVRNHQSRTQVEARVASARHC